MSETTTVPRQRTVKNGGQLLVELLREQGVDTAFGVVSVHNLPLVDELAASLRFVPVRHEAAAVNAADGYSRASGRLGVAITSTGTGAGNAAGSLIEALSAGGRVLHVTGQIDHEHLGSNRGVIHETRDQLGMLRAISKHAATIRNVDTAVDQLRHAITTALTAPGGPSSVEWPIDLQYQPQRWAEATPEPAAVPALTEAQLDEAAELLRAARRPVVWAGGGALDARTQLLELLERTGAGVLTSNAGRGSISEHDLRCIGNYASTPGGAQLLEESDLILTIGSHLRSNETRDYALPLPVTHVQIDLDAEALGRVHPATVGLQGDATEVLDRLVARLPSRTAVEPSWPDTVTATRERVRAEQRRGLGAQAQVCDDLRASLPTGSPVARDVTIPSSTWGNRLLPIDDPRTNIFPRGGGIGQGLAMAIGAACARPDVPTAAIVGDGGLAVHLGELLTLAQERPWLVLILFNDGGYGVLRNMQDKHLGRRSGVDLHTPDFAALAGACGGLVHAHVTDVADFRPTLDRLLEVRGPAILEVDVVAIGELPVPFVPPVKIPDL